MKAQSSEQQKKILPGKALGFGSEPRKLAILTSITQTELSRLEALILQTLRHQGYTAQVWQPACSFRCGLLVGLFNQVFGSKEADFLATSESVIVVYDETGDRHGVDLFASIKQVRESLCRQEYVHALRLHKDQERPQSYWQFRTMLAKHLGIELFEAVEIDQQPPLHELVQRTLARALKDA